MDFSQIPKPVLWGGAIVIVLVLVLAARSSSANAAPVPQQAIPPLDPNEAMVEQAGIAARTSGFQSLLSGVTMTLQGQTAADVANMNAYFSEEAIATEVAGAVEQTQITSDAATAQTIATQGGETTRSGIAAAAAQYAANLTANQNLATIAANQEIADTQSRNALAMTSLTTAAARKASTDNAITQDIRSVCSGIVSVITFGWGRC